MLALLALALLVLPFAPLRHAAQAAPAPVSHRIDPCPDHAAPATRPEVPARPTDRADGLACCAAAPCTGLQGAPPPVPAAMPLVPVAAAGRPAAPTGLPGRDIPPDPRPPRAA